MESRWDWLRTRPLPWPVIVTLSNFQDEDVSVLAQYKGEVTSVHPETADLNVLLANGRHLVLREEPVKADFLWFCWDQGLDVQKRHPQFPHQCILWQPLWHVDLWNEYQASQVFDALPCFDRALCGVVTDYLEKR